MLVSGQLYKAEEENELRMNMYIYVVYSTYKNKCICLMSLRMQLCLY